MSAHSCSARLQACRVDTRVDVRSTVREGTLS
jgi:hypothetical protein